MSLLPIHEAARALEPDVVGWRRELHRHPELGFEETRTAELVIARLRDLGLELRTGVAETGVLGLLRAPAGPGRPGVLLRADMDALPIQEVEGREYGSRVPGKMHACGHDGHTAMLLGAATLLAGRRETLACDVLFCFQPGEEGMGGAERMIEEGALDWIEIGAAYALHLWSWTPCGTAELRPGPMMAAQDEFRARIVGRGGHGALPHQTADPIVAAAQAVTALQTVVSRSVDPIEPAVLSIGSLHAGTAANIIPDGAEIVGTLRSFHPEVRETLRTRVAEILRATAEAGGCRAEVEIQPGYPAVVNDPGATEHAREVAREVLGEDHVRQTPPLLAAEDFAYFLERCPGAFVLLGARNEDRGITAPHHSPEFDIDESALPLGTELLARLALQGR